MPAARRYEITDEVWNKIKHLIPLAATGRPPKDNRLMFNAIMWLVRSGASWRGLPERYEPWETVYSKFRE